MQGLVKFLYCIGIFCLCISNLHIANAQNCTSFTIVGNGTVSNVICQGDNNGAVAILVNDISADTLFAFIDGVTTPTSLSDTLVGGSTLYANTFDNLPAGSYNIIVVDGNILNPCADTIQVTVAEPTDAFSVVIDSSSNANCGNNGYIHAQASGGWSFPTTFTWDGVDPGNNPIAGFPRTLGPDLSAVSEGTYTVTAMDDEGCTQSDQITISGGSPFTIDLSITNGNLPLELGDSLDILVTPSAPSPDITYTWFPSTALTPLSLSGDSIRVQPCTKTTYLVYAIDPVRLCDDLDSITVTIEGEFNPWIPNIFNPESFNPNNNKFQVFGFGMEAVEMEIYDRKGALLYQNGPDELIGAWDGSLGDSGTLAVTGKYLYVLKIRSICGDIITRSGGISLLR